MLGKEDEREGEKKGRNKVRQSRWAKGIEGERNGEWRAMVEAAIEKGRPPDSPTEVR